MIWNENNKPVDFTWDSVFSWKSSMIVLLLLKHQKNAVYVCQPNSPQTEPNLTVVSIKMTVQYTVCDTFLPSSAIFLSFLPWLKKRESERKSLSFCVSFLGIPSLDSFLDCFSFLCSSLSLSLSRHESHVSPFSLTVTLICMVVAITWSFLHCISFYESFICKQK